MTITINWGTKAPQSANNTSNLTWSDKSDSELLEAREKAQESIQRCFNAAMGDGRRDIESTPIVSQEAKYREQHREITEELIDRGVL